MKFLFQTKRRRIFTLLMILSVFIGVYIFIKNTSSSDPIEYEFEKVSAGGFSKSVIATGRLVSIDETEVGSELSGKITKVLVDDNDLVRKGQVLAELDKSTLEVKVRQAKINRDKAKATRDFNLKQWERTQKLFQNGAIKQSEYEQIEYEYLNAELNLKSASAEYEVSQVDYSYAEIKSPMDGIILSRSIEPGQTVAASLSAPTLFIIAKSLNEMKVEADIDEADIGMIKVGQEVEFTVDAIPNQNFVGVLQKIHIYPSTENNVVTYSVEITAPNPNGLLLPGLTANCTIYIYRNSSALTLSSKALQFKPDLPEISENKEENSKKRKALKPLKENEHIVWISSEEELIPRKIIVGQNNDFQYEVLEGIGAEDKIVTGIKANIASNNSSSPMMPGFGKRRSGGPPPRF